MENGGGWRSHNKFASQNNDVTIRVFQSWDPQTKDGWLHGPAKTFEREACYLAVRDTLETGETCVFSGFTIQIHAISSS
jgi:hypothetical protein